MVGNCRKIMKSSHCFFLTNRLVGDVLLATGFLSYLGPFNQNFRNLLLSRWEKEMSANKIPFSENLNLISMLTDAATVGVDLPYDILFIWVHVMINLFVKTVKFRYSNMFKEILFLRRLVNGTFTGYRATSSLFRTASSLPRQRVILFLLIPKRKARRGSWAERRKMSCRCDRALNVFFYL